MKTITFKEACTLLIGCKNTGKQLHFNGWILDEVISFEENRFFIFNTLNGQIFYITKAQNELVEINGNKMTLKANEENRIMNILVECFDVTPSSF